MKIASVNLNPFEIRIETDGTGLRVDGTYGRTLPMEVWRIEDLSTAPPSAAGVILGLALGQVTEDLIKAKAEYRSWNGEQVLVLREPVPSADPKKKPKRPTADEIKATIESSDSFMRLKGRIGFLSGMSNALAAVGQAVLDRKLERVEAIR